jgi:DNA-binding response OmpR family regulator
VTGAIYQRLDSGSTVLDVRRAIGNNPHEHRMIQTVHDYGYRFVTL